MRLNIIYYTIFIFIEVGRQLNWPLNVFFYKFVKLIFTFLPTTIKLSSFNNAARYSRRRRNAYPVHSYAIPYITTAPVPIYHTPVVHVGFDYARRPIYQILNQSTGPLSYGTGPKPDLDPQLEYYPSPHTYDPTPIRSSKQQGHEVKTEIFLVWFSHLHRRHKQMNPLGSNGIDCDKIVWVWKTKSTTITISSNYYIHCIGIGT